MHKDDACRRHPRLYLSLFLSSSFPCMREEEDQALTMESFFRMEDQRTSWSDNGIVICTAPIKTS